MMLEQENREQFLSIIKHHYQMGDQEDTFAKRAKAKGWEHFIHLGLPTKQMEVYKYVRLPNLFSKSFEPGLNLDVDPNAVLDNIFPECKKSFVVFVNGTYRSDLSNTSGLPTKIVICSLQEAYKSYGILLNNHLSQSLKEEKDPFAALNSALYDNGLFIFLPPKVTTEVPLQILSLVDAHNPMLIHPRIQLFAGAASELTVISNTKVLTKTPCFINQVIDLSLEDSSHIKYVNHSHYDSNEMWQWNAVRASLKKYSGFKSIDVTNGSMAVRNDYRVSLLGENGEANLNGVWMLSGKCEAHTNVLIDHQAPSCRSMQLFKGVLSDMSRSSFEGKIYVRKAAQKTDAYQLNNNLLLSDRANADSKPNLEVFADDVKASHGATIGQLDPEQLFYLKTRGYSEMTAKSLLIRGFCKEVIDMIPLASLRNEIEIRALK